MNLQPLKISFKKFIYIILAVIFVLGLVLGSGIVSEIPPALDIGLWFIILPIFTITLYYLLFIKKNTYARITQLNAWFENRNIKRGFKSIILFMMTFIFSAMFLGALRNNIDIIGSFVATEEVIENIDVSYVECYRSQGVKTVKSGSMKLYGHRAGRFTLLVSLPYHICQEVTPSELERKTITLLGHRWLLGTIIYGFRYPNPHDPESSSTLFLYPWISNKDKRGN